MGEAMAGVGKDILVVMVVGVVVLCGAVMLLPAFLDAQADADQAAAERVRAEAGLVEARMARDREANLHREQMFQMWSLVLFGERSSLDSKILSVVLGVVLGVICGVALPLLWWQWRYGALES